jgi:hypothetical protein
MLNRIVQHFGQCLSLAAASTPLTNVFQRGQSIALQGVEEIDVPVQAAFDGASTATGIDFEVLVSDDNINFDPIQTTQMDTGATGVVHTLAVSLGNTVRARLQTLDFRDAQYLAIAARLSNATTPKAGDAATAQLNYSMF